MTRKWKSYRDPWLFQLQLHGNLLSHEHVRVMARLQEYLHQHQYHRIWNVLSISITIIKLSYRISITIIKLSYRIVKFSPIRMSQLAGEVFWIPGTPFQVLQAATGWNLSGIVASCHLHSQNLGGISSTNRPYRRTPIPSVAFMTALSQPWFLLFVNRLISGIFGVFENIENYVHSRHLDQNLLKWTDKGVSINHLLLSH